MEGCVKDEVSGGRRSRNEVEMRWNSEWKRQGERFERERGVASQSSAALSLIHPLTSGFHESQQ